MMTFEIPNIPSLTAAKEQETYKEAYHQVRKITESNSVNGRTILLISQLGADKRDSLILD